MLRFSTKRWNALALILSLGLAPLACRGSGEGAEDLVLEAPKKKPAKKKTVVKTAKKTVQPVKAPVAPLPSETAAAATARPRFTNGLSPTQLDNCKQLVSRFTPLFQKLLAEMPPGTYVNDGGAPFLAAAAQPDACTDAARNKQMVGSIVDAVNQHSGRIGLILPLTGPRARAMGYVVEGMRTALQESGIKLEQLFILKDSGGDAKTAELRLAELIFKDKPAVVIGGVEKAEAELLSQWSNDLMLPVVLLGRDRVPTAVSRYAYRIYPDEKRLTATLVGTALARNLKKVAIVRPADGKSDRIAEYFRQALTQNGGQVAADLVFTPGNFESMSALGRQLFRTDASERRDEYKKAYKKAQDDAKLAGVPFNPKMVLLKPVVDFDAVFIPTDFRTVRHLAKLFKYQQVSKMTLIGDHQWRSPALIDPYDPFLEGAFFADFMGSYAKLPSTIGAVYHQSPYFTEPSTVVPVDFRMIGYRVARTALATVQRMEPARRTYASTLAGLRSDAAHYFGQGSVFDNERNANWPSYVFTVTRNNLSLENEYGSKGVEFDETKPAAAATAEPGRWSSTAETHAYKL